MDANIIIALIAVMASLVAASPGLVALYQNRNKSKAETTGLSADTAEKFQRLADKAAERVAAMQIRLDAVEDQLQSMEKQLRDSEARAAKFEGWAKRLAGQVTSLGGIPVPLEIEAK